MSSPFWERFSGASDIRCIEMKDHIHAQIASKTRNLAPDALVRYFHDASQQFWREMQHSYPEHAAKGTPDQ
ncbi:MAG TPA: hypothetical protein PLZ55_14680 [bacterium]|nr:hypothetical protein [bacterium]